LVKVLATLLGIAVPTRVHAPIPFTY